VLSIIVPIGVNDVFANDGSIILEKASLEHDARQGQYNSLVQVDSDTYALAYEGRDKDGFISTFTISSDGTSIVEVDTLEHDDDHGQYNSLVHVDSDTYALAYAGTDDDGFISTFTIDSDGDITPIQIQNHANTSEEDDVANLEHDMVHGQYNSLVQVDSNTIALAYAGAGEDGFISTFTISSSGVITPIQIQNHANTSEEDDVANIEHDEERGMENSLVQVDSDTYALAYEGKDRDGFISTFTISSSGVITPIQIQNHANTSEEDDVANIEHDEDRASHNSLVQVVSDTYALAYTSHGEDGFISTFTISSSGAITPIQIQNHANTSEEDDVANLEHEENRAIHNSLVQVDSDTYALAYTGIDADGFISTFTISSDGTSIVEVKTLEHDTDVGNYNSLVQVDSDTYALAYTSGSKDGWITTFTITEEVEEEKQRSGGCGFDRDCTAPRITSHGESETPDGFSINNNVFEENQERFNKNPTIQGTVGEPVTIKVRAWENMGTDKITLAIAYLAMHEDKPDWRDSTANIEFSIQQDEFKVYDKDKIFSAVGAVTERIEDPYGDNEALELLDITFTIIFAKPMESSHIGIQTIDHITNYDLVYFENALEILPKEIVQVEEVPEVVPEKVPEPQPEVIPEEIPEPEPPVKEPEPEVMLTTINEKTVLEFVDENMPAKHYVKRYITETEYREWFDVNYSEYKFWEGIGITQERFDQIVLEIQSEPKPKMVQTGFVLVPDDQKSFPLVEETYEPEPQEIEPVKEEKKGFFDWLFDLFN